MTDAPWEGSPEYWARHTPSAIAVIDGESTLSWAELNLQADALAESLASAGIGPGAVIATRCTVREEWVVIACATAKIGGQLLGLNWRLTPGECEHILTDSNASVLFLDDTDPSPLLPVIRSCGLRLAISLDASADGFADFADLVRVAGPARYSAGPAPLIIYTSGTTSVPKGVLRREVRDDEVEWLHRYQDELAARRTIRRGDVVLMTMPFHHLSGPWQARSNLECGNTLVLMRRFDPELALATIERWKVSSWAGVPTMFKRLSRLPKETLARYDVSSLRVLYVGSAPTPPSLKEWLIGYFGDCLQEGYGSTELGIVAVLPPDMQRVKPQSAGRVLDSVGVKILSPDGQELPIGQPGNIWIQCPAGIGRYINQPPLGPDVLDEDGYFRTGDCGYLDDDRYLYITDREIDMVISGGVNIYPAEIEAALITDPSVQDVAVIGVPDEEFGEQVIAFCELTPGASASEADLIAHARATLASYKVPRRIEIVAELPRSNIGKVLKRALRDPYWQTAERNV